MSNYDPLLLPENRPLLELESLLEACLSNEQRLQTLVNKEREYKLSTGSNLYERYRLYVEFKRTQVLLGANPLNEHWISLRNHILIVGIEKPLVSEQGLREIIKAQNPAYKKTDSTMVSEDEDNDNVDIYWKGKQVDFIELIYALIYAKKVVGGNDKQIRNKFAKVLNHKLKDEDKHLLNISNRKKNKASFLSQLKEIFENKIESKIDLRDQKKDKKR